MDLLTFLIYRVALILKTKNIGYTKIFFSIIFPFFGLRGISISPKGEVDHLNHPLIQPSKHGGGYSFCILK